MIIKIYIYPTLVQIRDTLHRKYLLNYNNPEYWRITMNDINLTFPQELQEQIVNEI